MPNDKATYQQLKSYLHQVETQNEQLRYKLVKLQTSVDKFAGFFEYFELYTKKIDYSRQYIKNFELIDEFKELVMLHCLDLKDSNFQRMLVEFETLVKRIDKEKSHTKMLVRKFLEIQPEMVKAVKEQFVEPPEYMAPIPIDEEFSVRVSPSFKRYY